MSRMSCTRRCLSCWKLSPLHTHISWLRAWCPGMLSHSHDWWGLDALELLLTMLGAWCPEEPNYAHISWLGAWCSVLVPNAFAYQEVLRWFKMWSCRVVKLLSCQDAKMIWDVKSYIVELSRIVELSEVWLWFDDYDLMMMFVYEVDYELDYEVVFDKCYVLIMILMWIIWWCLRLYLVLDIDAYDHDLR